MKYKPLTKYREYDENPFMENAIKEISEHTVKKKIFMNGNKTVVNQVINTDGEVVAHSVFLRAIEVDESQFIKFYLSNFALFYEVNKPAIKVFGYIINKCVVQNNDVFYIDFNEAKAFTGYAGDNIIRSGLSCLIESGIIARSTNPFKYFINPMVIFNGNRVTFANTYIKKRKKNNDLNNDQLSLW